MKTPEQIAETIRANLADRAGYEALDHKADFADEAKFIARLIAKDRRAILDDALMIAAGWLSGKGLPVDEFKDMERAIRQALLPAPEAK